MKHSGNAVEMEISVVGLGYVGLPSALAFHSSGFNVNGIDISDEVVETLNSGVAHFTDKTQDLTIPLESERWLVTNDFEKPIRNSEVILISVPTPVNSDKTPDLEYVRSAFSKVLENIEPEKKSTVVLESTVFPGVTRTVAEEAANKLGLRIGHDFNIAYSPERVSPGEFGKSVDKVTRIVGSDDAEIGKMLAELYATISDGGCTFVGQIEVAEAAKMVENTQRDIDIAFVNELSVILPELGIDVIDVLDAASTKWNFHRHDPGIGVGGHCIPVDPYYYIQIAKEQGLEPRMSINARRINESMPLYAIEEIKEKLGEIAGKRCLVLGYSYKHGIGDIRETPVKKFGEKLVELGVEVAICDPHVEIGEFPDWGEIVEYPPYEFDFDFAVLSTKHEEFIDLDWKLMKENCKTNLIYDGRRALKSDEMRRIGWIYEGIGVPNVPEN